MSNIKTVVNSFRNGVTGAHFFTAIVDGPDDYPDDKFLIITFEGEGDDTKQYAGCTAVLRIRDLNMLLTEPIGTGAESLSSWRPEWAFGKANLLIKQYREDLFKPASPKFSCPRCHQPMEDVGLVPRLRCTNEDCGA